MTTAIPAVQVGHVRFGAGYLGWILGPCVIESRDLCFQVAEKLAEMRAIGFEPVYKASYDKANRTSGQSFRGLGQQEGLRVLEEIKSRFGMPVTTDVHEPSECCAVGQVVDLIQIPALLCRQTDLLVAAAATGKPVNVKKGQFLAPWDMANVCAKLRSASARSILVTERGTTFGYQRLVNDMTAMPVMRECCRCPVVFDAGHSVQHPCGLGNRSSGERRFIPALAKAAIAAGADAVFLEVHPDPDNALSDGPNSWRLDDLPQLVSDCKRVYDATTPWED